jgi:thiamine monophosphate kinase
MDLRLRAGAGAGNRIVVAGTLGMAGAGVGILSGVVFRLLAGLGEPDLNMARMRSAMVATSDIDYIAYLVTVREGFL